MLRDHAANEVAPSPTRDSLRRFARAARRVIALSEAGILGFLVLLALVFYAIEPLFLSSSNLRAILVAMSFVGIIAVGQTLLLVGGEFDLSVGSNAGLSAVCSGWLMTSGGASVTLGIAGGLAVGAGVGLVNGLVVVRLGIPAFIATLGMYYTAAGVTQIITNGYPIYPLPASVSTIGQSQVLFGLGWSFVILIVLGVFFDVALRRTTFGRNLYATGGNREIARLVGINTDTYKIVSFVITGTLAAVAGMLVMGSLGSATTSVGQGWELAVIAGVVVGGVSLFGGIGTVLAGVIGILLLQVVQSGLVVVGVSANWQQVAVGTIMVLAVGLDLLRRRLQSGEAQSARRRLAARRNLPPRVALSTGDAPDMSYTDQKEEQ